MCERPFNAYFTRVAVSALTHCDLGTEWTYFQQSVQERMQISKEKVSGEVNEASRRFIQRQQNECRRPGADIKRDVVDSIGLQ